MELKLKNCIIGFLASAFQAFGIYHIHAQSPLTEGGIFGLTLLLNHHFGISPAVSGAALTTICYLVGLRILGKSFLGYSAVCAGGFSIGYALFEQFPPLWPGVGNHPLIGAVVGAFFIGLGSGICVRCGGATTGDDALAMALSRRWRTDIRNIYLVSDLAVLLLSLTFIPLGQIAYSLLTVILSGQLISLMQKFIVPTLFPVTGSLGSRRSQPSGISHQPSVAGQKLRNQASNQNFSKLLDKKNQTYTPEHADG